MKKVILVFAAVFLTVSGFAQKSVDIGLWGGSSTYLGDIKEASLITSDLNLGVLFRYNFNPRVAVRTQFTLGGFSAEGLVEHVNFDFEKNAQDLAAMMEINYLKFLIGDKASFFSPYIMGGIGVMHFKYITNNTYGLRMMDMNRIHPDVYPVDGVVNFIPVDEQVTALTIPFGFGVKFALGSRVGIGAEFQMRKLFNDKIDNLDDPRSFIKEDGSGNEEVIKYTTFWHNNDWPGYLGIYVTYKFDLNKRDCPAYDRKYW